MSSHTMRAGVQLRTLTVCGVPLTSRTSLE